MSECAYKLRAVALEILQEADTLTVDTSLPPEDFRSEINFRLGMTRAAEILVEAANEEQEERDNLLRRHELGMSYRTGCFREDA